MTGRSAHAALLALAIEGLSRCARDAALRRPSEERRAIDRDTHHNSMRCSGIDLARGDHRTLLAARYRCGDCSHAIRIEPSGWSKAITAGLLATLFIGGAARVFVHEMILVSGGPEGHGWYEWLMNGSVLLVGLLLGRALLFASRRSFASVAASLRNPVAGDSPSCR